MAMRLMIITILASLVYWSEALSCAPCNKEEYCRDEPTECPYGFGKDECRCCTVCAKGPGEPCTAIWDMDGGCGPGLKCQSINRETGEPGICIPVVP